MSRQEQQAWNDGRIAYRQGVMVCPRKSPEMRKAWRDGWDHEQRLNVAEKATEAQLAEGRSVLARLKEAVSNL